MEAKAHRGRPAPPPLFVLRQCCIIYRRWWTQAASDGTEQRRRAAPFSFVGLFPVGRLCAGWMAAFEETQAAIELRVKAGRDSPLLRHSNTTVTQCLSLPRPERKRKRQKEREWQRTGEIVGVFDFDRKGRGECFFCGEGRENQKEMEEMSWKKCGGKARDEKKDGGEETGLLYSAPLHWSMFIHDSALFTRLADATQCRGEAMAPLHQSTRWPHSSAWSPNNKWETAVLSPGLDALQRYSRLENWMQRVRSQNASESIKHWFNQGAKSNMKEAKINNQVLQYKQEFSHISKENRQKVKLFQVCTK